MAEPKGHDLLPFFNWNDQQKDQIVETLAMDLINDWTSDMDEEDKNSVINQLKGQIKAQLLPKLEAGLAKYQSEYINANDINHQIWDRLIEAALKNAFQNDHAEVLNVFINYNDIQLLMKTYYQEKELDASLAILRGLEEHPQMNNKRDVYLDLLKEFILVSGRHGMAALNENEEAALGKILFNPKGYVEVTARDTLIKKLGWTELSAGLQNLGVNWKNQILAPEKQSFVEALLNSILSEKKYEDLGKITRDLLHTNGNRDDNSQYLDSYLVIADKAMKERILAELDTTGNYLLDFIFTREEPEAFIERTQVIGIPALLQELKNPDQDQIEAQIRNQNQNLSEEQIQDQIQNQIQNQTRKYLKLLKSILVLGGMNILGEENKADLRSLLFHPNGRDEQEIRADLLKETSVRSFE